MVIRHVLQPVLNAGIGAAPMSELSLAAWPVALALIYTLTAPTMGLQQLTIALTEDKSSWRTVSRFVLIAGMCVSVCVVVVVFTPLLGVVLSQLFGLGEHVAALAAPAVRIMAVMPLTFALQGLFTGLLIKQADVASVSTAKTLNLVTAVLTLALVLRSTTVAGSVVAAVAMTSGALVETLWLYRRSRAATATLAGSKEEILALEQTRLH
jgi:Na+-driven multidrug efflux pump